jgi:diaminopimelate decarboxylase
MTPPALVGAPFLRWEGDSLLLDGIPLESLAARFGTPLYVYSRAAMLAALERWQRGLTGRRHLLCYAVKANSNLAVLQVFSRAGCGFDIVSGGELERVMAAGGSASRVVFSGVGKTREEMERALKAGVRCFNVESEGELKALSQIAVSCGAVAPVSVRVNPDVDARTHPYISTGLRDNKFGIAHDAALAAYALAAGLPGLKVIGIDCHIGSQLTQLEPYLDALERVLDLVEAIEARGLARIDHIDLGGGLGITYTDEAPPPAEELVARVLERLDARGHGQREILFEPGRSLVGNAGVMLASVLFLKSATRSPGESAAAKNFCIVDAAMNDLIRPAMYDARMSIVPCRLRDLEAQEYDVVGPVCESADWLGRDRRLAVQPGDIVAVLSAGAYGMGMASNYNSRPRAAEVMIADGNAIVVRERETIADLMRGEHLLDR